MKELVISWEETSSRVRYLANGIYAGDGSNGFNEILRTIKVHPELERVILKINTVGSGGKSLEQSLPFAGRYHELKDALGGREMVIDLL